MQHLVGLLNGEEHHTVCPYDENFRIYIRDAMATLTKRHPTTLMVDDDFRLFASYYRGCVCPLYVPRCKGIFQVGFACGHTDGNAVVHTPAEILSPVVLMLTEK